MCFQASILWAMCSYSFRKLLGYSLLVGILLTGMGCKTSSKVPYGYSSTTDFYDARTFETQPEYEPLALYTYHPTNFLVGNACVTEYTKTLGFEYTYPFTQPNERPNRLYSFVHNVYVNIRLTRRLGFGWKRRLKERINQCRTSSGDYRG